MTNPPTICRQPHRRPPPPGSGNRVVRNQGRVIQLSASSSIGRAFAAVGEICRIESAGTMALLSRKWSASEQSRSAHAAG